MITLYTKHIVISKQAFQPKHNHEELKTLKELIPDDDFNGNNGPEFLWDDAKQFFKKDKHIQYLLNTHQTFENLPKNELKDITNANYLHHLLENKLDKLNKQLSAQDIITTYIPYYINNYMSHTNNYVKSSAIECTLDSNKKDIHIFIALVTNN